MIAAVPPTTLVAGGTARTHAGGAPMTILLIGEYEVGADRHSAGVGPASTLARPRPRLS